MSASVTYDVSGKSLMQSLWARVRHARIKGRMPGFDWSSRFAHWALRIPLGGLLLYYGLQKFPDALVAPGSYGVPAVLFVLAALAEVLGPIALFFGGLIETWRPKNGGLRLAGDVMTRGGAFAGVAAVAGVIAFFYWGSLTIADLQVMALGLSLFLLFRGNVYGHSQRPVTKA
ncbi:DoxX family membrane protein [Roseibium denhamense]|uniref:DoxX protein n=1 Tax=Roseibium denhamense TaxID=76305 RepID=A0ABY1PFK8_9HYPH|nr:DoxX family membrane protein [Roseibium denhamense]MTI07821.1 DoxX family membrane protein [Roseibium denhamense]SMP31914.1 DoxX protein [Roseibium denhamense]